MAKRILISTVPRNFTTDPFDETALGYHVHLLSEEMLKMGVMPYSALDVFKEAQGGGARTIKRAGFLVLGEAVSRIQYVQWQEVIQYLRPAIWLKLLIDNVAAQDRESRYQAPNGNLERPARLLPEVCRDIRYWKLCNRGSGGITIYRPELRRTHGGRL